MPQAAQLAGFTSSGAFAGAQPTDSTTVRYAAGAQPTGFTSSGAPAEFSPQTLHSKVRRRREQALRGDK